MYRLLYILPFMFIVHTFVIGESLVDDYEDDDYGENTNSNSTNGSFIFTIRLKNMTRNEGKNVPLICEVQNLDLPKNTSNNITANTTATTTSASITSNNNNYNRPSVIFQWKHNEVLISKGDKKFKIRNYKEGDNRFRSVLKIENVEFMDQAFIECIANNGKTKIRSQGYLKINPNTAKWGSTSAVNHLKPNLESFDEITTFPNGVSKPSTDNDFLSSVPKSKTFSTTTFELSADEEEPQINLQAQQIYNGSEQFCQFYRGTICQKYFGNSQIFVQPPYTQREIEEILLSAFGVIKQSKDISTSCNKFAQPSLCFSAFPICANVNKINLYQHRILDDLKTITDKEHVKFKSIRSNLTSSLKRICRDECMLLENELCSKEYAIAKRHPVIGKAIKMEECEYLPSDVESSKNCLSLGVGDLNVIKDDTCYWDTGKLYKGIHNKSESGKDCIRWSRQFLLPTHEYPELAGHNYCRNPGEKEAEPFCFVEQNKRESCGISKCVYIFGLYVAVFVFLGASFVSFIVFCYCKRKNKGTRNLQNKDLPPVNKNIYGNPGPSSPMEMNSLLPLHAPSQRNHNSHRNGFQTVPQYTYKEVRFLEELGEGAFGKVYKGELKTKSGKIFVAVKSLKENASAKTQADFQREIELISELKHANIICLLGVVMKQEPMCMLFEFMSEGDLHEFLIANSPNEGKFLTQEQFLHIAVQIAKGMEYLSGNHYVHRDLAARNCLVSKEMVVKISDFGLSRDMYSCDYYRVQSKSLLPVRWMPPESILYGKFTTESDVWSYGVVLWEIYSYGLQPYYGYNNQEVINMIRSRKLLPCPDACPSYCYSLMVECWAEQAIRRPNFSEIAHRLKVWKQSETSNGAYYKSSSTQPTPQKYSSGHGSKSSHAGSDSQHTVCPTTDATTTFTWEREHKQPSNSRLHDSQSSLTSRGSSLGNNTQSTSISNEGRREKQRHKKSIDSLERLNPKNIVVSTTNGGDNYETKLSPNK